ncbi:Hypothetical predicted protein [Pelobates cultripes]|uniref:Uncharacterized protein n=1 Tax=Pelobates cultripes TaxID=61616 RepID=A0AAD1WV13_PELCU|nr:Hypothetical predicted protein [Pelobates cultripes]
MGRNRRTEQLETPRDSHLSSQQGPMDGFLQPPRGTVDWNESPGPAPRPPASTVGGEASALERIGNELRTMAAAMATKADLLTTTIQGLGTAGTSTPRQQQAPRRRGGGSPMGRLPQRRRQGPGDQAE